MKEEWRPVRGYEGIYSISNMGQVRSEDREVEGPRGPHMRRGVMLRPGTPRGVRTVILSRNGKPRGRTVGSLVAEAFLEGYDESLNVIHVNGNTTDDRISNLSQSSALPLSDLNPAPWDRRPRCDKGHAMSGKTCSACHYWKTLICAGSKLGIPVEALEELYATHSLT